MNHWNFRAKKNLNHKRVTWDTSLQLKFMFINNNTSKFKVRAALMRSGAIHSRYKTNFLRIIHWQIQCCSNKCGKFMFGSGKWNAKTFCQYKLLETFVWHISVAAIKKTESFFIAYQVSDTRVCFFFVPACEWFCSLRWIDIWGKQNLIHPCSYCSLAFWNG